MSEVYVDGTTPLNAVHMNALQQRVEKGVANGYASLNSSALVPVAQLPPSLPADSVVVAGTRIIANKLLAGDAQPNYVLLGSGEQRWGVGGATAYDVNLYRSAGFTLKTDGSFRSAGRVVANDGAAIQITLDNNGYIEFGSALDTNLYRRGASQLGTDSLLVVRAGTADQVWLGQGVGPGGQAGLGLGASVDTILYRSAAGVLRTDGYVQAAQAVVAKNGVAEQVVMGDIGAYVSGGTRPGLVFGSALDTNLYRSAANQLATDDSFYMQGTDTWLWMRNATSYASLQIYHGVAGEANYRHIVSAGGQHMWGDGTNATDTNLYRSAAGQIKTDGYLRAGADVIAQDGVSAAQMIMGARGPSAQAGLLFGTAGDTNLYRSAASTLKTDGALHVAGANFVFAPGLATQTVIGTVNSSAGIQFGSAADTNLYRSAANALKTDGDLHLGKAIYLGESGISASVVFGGDSNLYRLAAGGLATDGYLGSQGAAAASAFLSRHTGDAGWRWYVDTDGKQNWGSGTGGYDTNLYRAAASNLVTDGLFTVKRTAAGNAAFSTTGISGDTADRFAIYMDGRLDWGGGAGVRDISLQRSGPGVLMVSNDLLIQGSLRFPAARPIAGAVGGTQALKLRIFDEVGNTIGYIPIYPS